MPVTPHTKKVLTLIVGVIAIVVVAVGTRIAILNIISPDTQLAADLASNNANSFIARLILAALQQKIRQQQASQQPANEPTTQQSSGQNSASSTTPAPGAVEATIVSGSDTYKVIDGKAYKVNGSQLTLVDTLYDPNYLPQNYTTINGQIYRVDPSSGKKFLSPSSFSEGFENVSSLNGLLTPEHGWTTFTLQSPKTPTVDSYNKLRDAILAGSSSFIDNTLALNTDVHHSGNQSLCASTVAPTAAIQTSKASLESTLFHAAQGNTIDADEWVYLKSGMPTGVLDLEASYILNGPGMRVLFDDNGHPRVELKWGDKPTWNVPGNVTLTPGKWTHIKLETKLSSNNDGTIKLWFDDKQVLDATGQTLALPSAVIDRLEVAITAADQNTALCIDDVNMKITR